MGLGRSAAVVVGSFPLGESDRVVTFFSRDFGKIRGVARAARRLRSRFGGGLELLTLGELVFFDAGRSDLVQIDHFDVVRPFQRVREDLDRLGQAAWMAECVVRLTADRDPNAVVFGLLLRALRSLEAGVAPRRVAVLFGLRAVEALGHRLRTDACAGCGRRQTTGTDPTVLDVAVGGRLCPACVPGAPGVVRVAGATLATMQRLRRLAWAEATALGLGRAEPELREVLDLQVAHLAGQPARTTRFVRELERFASPPRRGTRESS